MASSDARPFSIPQLPNLRPGRDDRRRRDSSLARRNETPRTPPPGPVRRDRRTPAELASWTTRCAALPTGRDRSRADDCRPRRRSRDRKRPFRLVSAENDAYGGERRASDPRARPPLHDARDEVTDLAAVRRPASHTIEDPSGASHPVADAARAIRDSVAGHRSGTIPRIGNWYIPSRFVQAIPRLGFPVSHRSPQDRGHPKTLLPWGVGRGVRRQRRLTRSLPPAPPRTATRTAAARRWDPTSGSTACSGCGISPTTLPAALRTPAMWFVAPFGLCASPSWPSSAA